MEMEFLRRTIKQIQYQLGVLTLSQRFAIFLCLVIMFGAIFWMVKYSSRQTMAPLLNQSFNQDEIERISAQLNEWQQGFDVVGDRILVPSGDRLRLRGQLGYAQLLPENTSMSYENLLEDNGSVFMSSAQRETRNLIIKQMELARSIENFPGVDRAKVFINASDKRRLSNMTPTASASVMITTSSGALENSRLGTTIADFVSNANDNMKRQNVSVVANGQPLQVAPEGQALPGNFLELKSQYEQYYRDKLVSIAEVPNVLVQVDVTPETDQIQEISKKIPGEEGGSWLATVNSKSDVQSRTNTEGSREPGIQSNVGSGTTAGGGTNQNETSEQDETSRQAFPGSLETITQKGPGNVSDITVTMLYPKSYFRNIAKLKSSDKAVEPTEAEVTAQEDLEIPELRKKVMGVIGKQPGVPENEAKVVIGTYWDTETVLAAGIGAVAEADLSGTSSMDSLGSLARGYSKQIAVSALALMSLFMVLMMVKKASGPIEMEESEAEALMTPGKKPIDVMSPEDSHFAEADDAGGLLAGMELDESAVQSQQMLEQIRSMVKDAPNKVAGLVSKWVAQGD